MFRLEAIARSVFGCYSLSSSGTILGECQPHSSSRSSGITRPQPVMARTRVSSFSRALFDRPSQPPFSTHDSINHDMVILLSSPLGVPATPTLSLSSSLATNSRTTSLVMPIRRDDDSPETTSSSTTSTTSTTFATFATSTTSTNSATNGGNGVGNPTINTGTPPGFALTTAIPSTYAWTTTVTPYDTSSQQDAVSPLPTAIASSATTSSTSISSGLVTGSQGLVSQSSGAIVVTSEWTSGGYTYHTMMTLASTSPGSVQPSPTGTVALVPSTSKSSLPLILGLVFGLIFLIAFAVIIYKFCARRRRQAKLLPQPLPDQENHNYQEQPLRDPTPPVAPPATLERPPRAPPLVRRVYDWRARCRSQGDSSEPMSEMLSDPFEYGSLVISSRTSEPAPNNNFGVFGENLSTLHTSDISDMNILAPIPSNVGTSIHSSYFSPTGHYRERQLPI